MTRLAWVGTPYQEAAKSSLRVATGLMEQVVVEGDKVCHKDNSPCYFLDAMLPQDVPRCVDAGSKSGEIVHQCDDVITQFKG